MYIHPSSLVTRFCVWIIFVSHKGLIKMYVYNAGQYIAPKKAAKAKNEKLKKVRYMYVHVPSK